MRFFPGLLLLTGLLSGCASLTEDECAIGDWAAVGANDASQGQKTSRFFVHQKACKRYNILPDQAQYIEGYRRGLLKYCTPTNGFNVGRNGYTYQNICPSDAEAQFMRGYERGKNLHDIETAMADARNRLGVVRQKINEERNAPSSGEKEKAETQLQRRQIRLEHTLRQLGQRRDRSLVEADDFLQSISPDV